MAGSSFSLRRIHAKRPIRSLARVSEAPLPVATYALLAAAYGRLDQQQLEAARKVARRRLRRQGRLQLLVFARFSLTRKPLQSRMGRGKGRLAGQFCWVRPGQPLFLLRGVPASRARVSLAAAAAKLPVSLRVAPLRSLRA
jgi:large subunit ribosomal protein L16